MQTMATKLINRMAGFLSPSGSIADFRVLADFWKGHFAFNRRYCRTLLG